MDLQQPNPSNSNTGGHAPYYEMMSSKCKSPTAALTCPDTPQDHSVLPEVLKSDEYSDTAAKSASPVPEASLVPRDDDDDAERAEEESDNERENTEAESHSTKASSAYSIVDILNADKEQDEDKSGSDNVTAAAAESLAEPPTEQKLKSNLPATHPLKHAVKSNVVIESPRPADFDMYHASGGGGGGGDQAKESEETPGSQEGSLLRKNLTAFDGRARNGTDDDKSEKSEKPAGLLSPSTEQYDAWLRRLPQKAGEEPQGEPPQAKKQKTEPLSPSVANSYLQGQQAAASLWYQQNLATAAAAAAAATPYSFPGALPDPFAAAAAAAQMQQLSGVYPGYLIPDAGGKDKKKSDTMMQKDHDKLFHCRRCPVHFTSPEKLLKHEATHPSPRPFNCGLALKRKVAEVDVSGSGSGAAERTCLLCMETFASAVQLQVHVAQTHRKQSAAAAVVPAAVLKDDAAAAVPAAAQHFSCSFCLQYLPSRLELMEHEKIHLEQRGKATTTAGAGATEATGVKCPRCPQVFSDAFACKEHERKHHHAPIRRVSQAEFPEAEIRQAVLQECLRNADLDHTESINNNNSLDSNSGVGAEQHTCPICRKSFVSAKLLKSHVKYSHLDERPYMCSICSKSFKQKATLKQHEKLHSDEKPYVCNVCSRGFVYPSRLKTHSQTCKGEPVMSP